ncbi:MAG TPA: hypothetical protein VJ908_05225 [Wenzhouxiangellaceae bacterium]|nr:hypothetical protein [Wenzhouxiangellaceae bacterium]
MKMPYPQNLSRLLCRTAAVSAIAISAFSANALEVTGGFTGWWGQPDQQNHGLIVSISRLPSGEKTGVLYWAHFDDEGNPSWLFAQGDIDDDMIDARVFAFEGITFMQGQDPDANFGEPVGSMEVVFSDCVTGEVTFDTTAVGAGSFQIQRLTDQPGAECSGGISDDMGPGSLPEQFEIALAPTDVIPGARGTAEFKATPGHAEFEVEIEQVPAGEFELQVGGESRGLITVVDTGTGSGEIEFRSPAGDDQLLLDFDPRDQIIDVLLGGQVVLTALAPEEGDFPGNPPAFDLPIRGTLELELELVNEGVFADGEAGAEFEMRKNRAEFEIEVSDIPAGTYPVFIGGINQADITVQEDDMGETGGDLEFAFPYGGVEPLDFDPRGQSIEIFEGATLLFSGQFPEGEPDDDGNGPGNGNGNGPPGG